MRVLPSTYRCASRHERGSAAVHGCGFTSCLELEEWESYSRAKFAKHDERPSSLRVEQYIGFFFSVCVPTEKYMLHAAEGTHIVFVQVLRVPKGFKGVRL